MLAVSIRLSAATNAYLEQHDTSPATVRARRWAPRVARLGAWLEMRRSVTVTLHGADPSAPWIRIHPGRNHRTAPVDVRHMRELFAKHA
ncbi:hypothetical protein GCM10010488_15430 [Oerskovia jenensis]|uniref:Integrase n=1 Tax=Oerskovia jenensis TaxID=162169 RepID=A0ABS2L9V4_9CELL|nr:hypothetical protein [Oerskovia jenensis]